MECDIFPFSALILLFGRQEGHPTLVTIWLELCTIYSSSCHHHLHHTFLQLTPAKPGSPGKWPPVKTERECTSQCELCDVVAVVWTDFMWLLDYLPSADGSHRFNIAIGSGGMFDWQLSIDGRQQVPYIWPYCQASWLQSQALKRFRTGQPFPHRTGPLFC